MSNLIPKPRYYYYTKYEATKSNLHRWSVVIQKPDKRSLGRIDKHDAYEKIVSFSLQNWEITIEIKLQLRLTWRGEWLKSIATSLPRFTHTHDRNIFFYSVFLDVPRRRAALVLIPLVFVLRPRFICAKTSWIKAVTNRVSLWAVVWSLVSESRWGKERIP